MLVLEVDTISFAHGPTAARRADGGLESAALDGSNQQDRFGKKVGVLNVKMLVWRNHNRQC